MKGTTIEPIDMMEIARVSHQMTNLERIVDMINVCEGTLVNQRKFKLTCGGDIDVFVESSVINTVSYSVSIDKRDDGQLFIMFNNGKLYMYEDVPFSEFFMLITSDSVGKYFNEFIRGEYTYTYYGNFGDIGQLWRHNVGTATR